MIATIRSLLAGNSGSGKTTRAWTLYLSKFPRRLILDQTGEWYGRCDVHTTSLGECVRALQTMAPHKRWTVSYSLDDDRFPELVHWLIPVPNLDQSPVLMVGGAVLLVDEVDLLAPQGFASVEVRTLYRRSRHVGLSIVSATQRPANVSREVSAQSTQLVACYLSEPRDRDYMTDVMRWPPEYQQRWLDWCRQHPHGAVWKEVQTGRLLLLPEQGAPRAWTLGDVHQSAPQARQSRQAGQAQQAPQADDSDQSEPPQPPRKPALQRQQLDTAQEEVS